MEELGEVVHRLAVVRDARLRQPEPDVAQRLQLRRQRHEGRAARRVTQGADGRHGVAGGEDAPIMQHGVDLVRAVGKPLHHVLWERLAARLRQHHLAADLRERRHEHRTQEAARADADRRDRAQVDVTERREGFHQGVGR